MRSLALDHVSYLVSGLVYSLGARDLFSVHRLLSSLLTTLEQKKNNMLGTVVVACLKPEDHEFNASVQGYREKFISKINTPIQQKLRKNHTNQAYLF